jgi:hypothetical protein
VTDSFERKVRSAAVAGWWVVPIAVGCLRKMREAHRAGLVRPTEEQQKVERLFPAVAP